MNLMVRFILSVTVFALKKVEHKFMEIASKVVFKVFDIAGNKDSVVCGEGQLEKSISMNNVYISFEKKLQNMHTSAFPACIANCEVVEYFRE